MQMHRLAFASASALQLSAKSCVPMLGPHRCAHFVARRRTRHLRGAVMQQPMAVDSERDPGAVPGTSLRVLRYPHPLLRAPNEEFAPEEFKTAARQLAKEMLLVMYASRGVGLAAPQVGVNKRLMVFNAEGDSKAWVHETVLINPRIVASSKAMDVEGEACLSFPDMSGEVRRPEWVKVEAFKINGKRFKVKYEGWKARLFQHEYDHLDGVLYIDRLEDEERAKVKERLGELRKEYEQSKYKDLDPAL